MAIRSASIPVMISDPTDGDSVRAVWSPIERPDTDTSPLPDVINREAVREHVCPAHDTEPPTAGSENRLFSPTFCPTDETAPDRQDR